MDNLELYNKVRAVPEDAQKKITGGRLNGMTNINPVWRIKTLTQQFGVCGFGWYYEPLKMWTEEIEGEVLCFVNISLYIKMGGEWSKPIFGTGGSKIAASESKGIRPDDEGFKKATTDAISVACKSLGIGAEVYWADENTKYDNQPVDYSDIALSKISDIKVKSIVKHLNGDTVAEKYIKEKYSVMDWSEINEEQYREIANNFSKYIEEAHK